MWVDDGSNSISSVDVARCVGDKLGSQSYNALYQSSDQDVGMMSGLHCYRFEMLDGDHGWVGVTTLDKFQPGWKCKGLKYGGNLSDGSGAVKVGWGPVIKQGDVVDMRVDFVNFPKIKQNKVSIVFYHNGRCLGEAFNVPKPTASLYPFISFSKKGDAMTIEKLPYNAIPEQVTPTQPQYSGIFGPWRLESYTSHDVSQAVVPPKVIAIIKKDASDALAISVKVANTLTCKLQVTHDGYECGPVMSTLMMPLPPLQETEAFISQLLAQGLLHIELLEEGSIRLENANGATAVWSRHIESIPEPYTKNIFD